MATLYVVKIAVVYTDEIWLLVRVNHKINVVRP